MSGRVALLALLVALLAAPVAAAADEPLAAAVTGPTGAQRLVQLDPADLSVRPGGVAIPGRYVIAVSPDGRRALLIEAFRPAVAVAELDPPRRGPRLDILSNARPGEASIVGAIWPRADRVVLLVHVSPFRPGGQARAQTAIVVVDPVTLRVLSRRPLRPALTVEGAIALPDRLVIERRRGRRVHWEVIGASGRIERRIDLGEVLRATFPTIAVRPGSARLVLAPDDSPLIDVDLDTGSVTRHSRPDLAPASRPGRIVLDPTLVWLDDRRLLLTGVAAGGGAYGSATLRTGAWVLDAATWAATPLDVGGSNAWQLRSGGALLTGYARYQPAPVFPRVAGSFGVGLAGVDAEGVVRWRAYPGRRRVWTLEDGAGRVYAATSSQARDGDVLDAATGARLGRWRTATPIVDVDLLRHDDLTLYSYLFG